MKIITILLIGLLSGCGTIVNGRKQNVGISSNPSGAVSEFNYRKSVVVGRNKHSGGPIYGMVDFSTSCVTPCSLNLDRNVDPYLLTIKKEGYEPASATLYHRKSGLLWGNILFGGIIGLVIDFNSGGAYKLKPESIMVDLKK